MPVDRSEAIRACHLFAEADEATLANLARRSWITRHAAGGAVFMAGDEADGLRVVLEGLVRIWIADDEGRELTLALLEPGEPFGEIALLDGLPRTANATAAGKLPNRTNASRTRPVFVSVPLTAANVRANCSGCARNPR